MCLVRDELLPEDTAQWAEPGMGRFGVGVIWEKGCGGILREADSRQRDWVGGGLPVPVITLVGSFFFPPCLLSLEEPELPRQPSCAHPWVPGQAEGILGRDHEKLRKRRL